MADFLQLLKLFLALRQDPLQSNSALGKIFKVSSNTIKNWKTQLNDLGIVPPSKEITDPILGKRARSDVAGQINPHALGLKRVLYVLTGITGKENLINLRRYCDDHPYTYYQITGYSIGPILYALFDVPPLGLKNLSRFIKRLQTEDLFSDYIEMIEHDSIHTVDDIVRLYNNELTNVDITELLAMYLTEKNNVVKQFVNTNLTLDKERKLDELNLSLIRELTINGRVNPTMLTTYDKYKDYDRSTLSRRLSYIKSNFVTKYTLDYNRKFIGYDGVILIWGEAGTEFSFRIMKMLESGKFPFSSNFYYNKTNFVWHLLAPPVIVSLIIEEILPYTKSINSAILNNKSSMRYFFYPVNYISKSSSWNASADYMNPGFK